MYLNLFWFSFSRFYFPFALFWGTMNLVAATCLYHSTAFSFKIFGISLFLRFGLLNNQMEVHTFVRSLTLEINWNVTQFVWKQYSVQSNDGWISGFSISELKINPTEIGRWFCDFSLRFDSGTRWAVTVNMNFVNRWKWLEAIY